MIGVYGAGAFGTALAICLAKAGHPVRLYGRDPKQIGILQRKQINTTYLPDIRFPANLTPTSELSDLRDVDYILMATPAQTTRAVLQSLQPTCPIIMCGKGLEAGTQNLQSEIVLQVLGDIDVAVLSGPSFAIDIAKGRPTALTIAAKGPLLERLQTRLATPNLRLYGNTDLVGVQLGGALKNVYAIACGLVEGAGYGDSAKAALMTRCFAEMARFATRQGAQTETLFGLSGFGDLVLTCSSLKSRNFGFGIAAAKKGNFLPSATVEGIATTHALAALGEKLKSDLPICYALADFLKGKTDIQGIKDDLLSRPLTQEI